MDENSFNNLDIPNSGTENNKSCLQSKVHNSIDFLVSPQEKQVLFSASSNTMEYKSLKYSDSHQSKEVLPIISSNSMKFSSSKYSDTHPDKQILPRGLIKRSAEYSFVKYLDSYDETCSNADCFIDIENPYYENDRTPPEMEDNDFIIGYSVDPYSEVSRTPPDMEDWDIDSNYDVDPYSEESDSPSDDNWADNFNHDIAVHYGESDTPPENDWICNSNYVVHPNNEKGYSYSEDECTYDFYHDVDHYSGGWKLSPDWECDSIYDAGPYEENDSSPTNKDKQVFSRVPSNGTVHCNSAKYLDSHQETYSSTGCFIDIENPYYENDWPLSEMEDNDVILGIGVDPYSQENSSPPENDWSFYSNCDDKNDWNFISNYDFDPYSDVNECLAFKSEHSLLLRFYEKLVDDLMEKFSIGYFEVCVSLQHIICNHGGIVNGRLPSETNYRDKSYCLGYLHRYAACHSVMISDSMSTILNSRSTNVLSEKLSKNKLNIMFLGSGPGNDFVGFLTVLHRYRNDLLDLDVTVVDKMSGWKEVFNEIIHKLKQSECDKVGQLFNDVNLTTSFISADLKNREEWNTEMQNKLKTADIVFLVKVLSHIPNDDKLSVLQTHQEKQVRFSASSDTIDYKFSKYPNSFRDEQVFCSVSSYLMEHMSSSYQELQEDRKKSPSVFSNPMEHSSPKYLDLQRHKQLEGCEFISDCGFVSFIEESKSTSVKNLVLNFEFNVVSISEENGATSEESSGLIFDTDFNSDSEENDSLPECDWRFNSNCNAGSFYEGNDSTSEESSQLVSDSNVESDSEENESTSEESSELIFDSNVDSDENESIYEEGYKLVSDSEENESTSEESSELISDSNVDSDENESIYEEGYELISDSEENESTSEESSELISDPNVDSDENESIYEEGYELISVSDVDSDFEENESTSEESSELISDSNVDSDENESIYEEGYELISDSEENESTSEENSGINSNPDIDSKSEGSGSLSQFDYDSRHDINIEFSGREYNSHLAEESNSFQDKDTKPYAENRRHPDDFITEDHLHHRNCEFMSPPSEKCTLLYKSESIGKGNLILCYSEKPSSKIGFDINEPLTVKIEHSILLQFYEELVDDLMEKFSIEYGDVSASLQNMIRNHGDVVNGRLPSETNYCDKSYCLGYLHRYAACHSFMISDSVSTIFNSSPSNVLRTKFNTKQLNVMFLGGGPGNDFLGFFTALHRYHNNILDLDVTVVDKMSGWEDVFNETVQKLKHSEYGQFYHLFKDVNITTSFISTDLKNCEEWNSDMQIKLMRADLIFLVKVLSHIPNDNKLGVLKNIILCTKPGALLIYVDHPYPQKIFASVSDSLRPVYKSRIKRYNLKAKMVKFGNRNTTRCTAEVRVFERW
ncbi:unnamed protein product [Larinioides sclopetarius]|uniref:Uncharacterized protein n=1 Tax=Larinioides sclopetarius TaxID=280406 RepID=A0AAV1ZN46_9ARAC